MNLSVVSGDDVVMPSLRSGDCEDRDGGNGAGRMGQENAISHESEFGFEFSLASFLQTSWDALSAGEMEVHQSPSTRITNHEYPHGVAPCIASNDESVDRESVTKQQTDTSNEKSSDDASSMVEATSTGVEGVERDSPNYEDLKLEHGTVEKLIASDSSSDYAEDASDDVPSEVVAHSLQGRPEVMATEEDLFLIPPFSVVKALEEQEDPPASENGNLVTMSRTQFMEAIESGNAELHDSPLATTAHDELFASDAVPATSLADEGDLCSTKSFTDDGLEIALTDTDQAGGINMPPSAQKSSVEETEALPRVVSLSDSTTTEVEESVEDTNHHANVQDTPAPSVDGVALFVEASADEMGSKGEKELESSAVDLVKEKSSDGLQRSLSTDSIEDAMEDSRKPVDYLEELEGRTMNQREHPEANEVPKEPTREWKAQFESEQQVIFVTQEPLISPTSCDDNDARSDEHIKREPCVANDLPGTLQEGFMNDATDFMSSKIEDTPEDFEEEGVEFPIALSLQFREEKVPEPIVTKKQRKSFLSFSKRSAKSSMSPVAKSGESGGPGTTMPLSSKAKRKSLIEGKRKQDMSSETSKSKISSRVTVISKKSWFRNRHRVPPTTKHTKGKDSTTSEDATLVTDEEVSYSSTTASEDEPHMTNGDHPVTTFLFSFDGGKLMEKDQDGDITIETPVETISEDDIEDEVDGFGIDSDPEWATLRFDGEAIQALEEPPSNELPSDFMESYLDSDLRAVMADILPSDLIDVELRSEMEAKMAEVLDKMKDAASVSNVVEQIKGVRTNEFCGDKCDAIGVCGDDQSMVIATCFRDHTPVESFAPVETVRNEINNRCALDDLYVSEDDNSLVVSEEDEDSLFMALDETSVERGVGGFVLTEAHAEI